MLLLRETLLNKFIFDRYKLLTLSARMHISLSYILFVLMIFQLLFLSLFLFTREKGKRTSNILLGLFFFFISLNLLDFFLFRAGIYSPRSWLAGWGSCLPLLFGPFIYMYTQSVLRKDFYFKLNQWIHFIPFAIFFAGTEIYFLSQPDNIRKSILENLLRQQVPGSVSIVSTLIFIQFLFYIIASFRLVSRYKKNSNQFISNKSQQNINWLNAMLLFFLLIIILSIVNGLLAQTSLAPYYLAVFNLIVFAMLVFIMTVFLKALQVPNFFSFSEEGDPGAETNGFRPVQVPETEKIERERIVELVLQCMQNEKPFLEPELTLDQLASRLSIRPRLLSQSINEGLGQNFYDFINRYRIQEASRLLTHPRDPKITILEVLYEVGFNSKSSFNTLFKKYIGLTPTEFRKKQNS